MVEKSAAEKADMSVEKSAEMKVELMVELLVGLLAGNLVDSSVVKTVELMVVLLGYLMVEQWVALRADYSADQWDETTAARMVDSLAALLAVPLVGKLVGWMVMLLVEQ